MLLVSKVMLIPSIVSCLGKGLIFPNYWDNSVCDYSKLHTILVNDEQCAMSSTVQIVRLGQLLYVDFYYLFLILGGVLLATMLGALVVSTSKVITKE
jgi:hypothetical protein